MKWYGSLKFLDELFADFSSIGFQLSRMLLLAVAIFLVYQVISTGYDLIQVINQSPTLEGLE
jgi:hypothetical protein